MPLVLVAMEHIHVPIGIRLCTSISWLQVSGKKGGILEANRAGEQTAMISYLWTWLKPCAQYIPLNSHWTTERITSSPSSAGPRRCPLWLAPPGPRGRAVEGKGDWKEKDIFMVKTSFANFMEIRHHENTLLRPLPGLWRVFSSEEAWSLSFVSSVYVNPTL